MSKIYFIESRDKLSSWLPARSLNGQILSYRSRKEAKEAMASLYVKHIGTKVLERCEQRYRLRYSEYAERSDNKGARYVSLGNAHSLCRVCNNPVGGEPFVECKCY